MSETATTATTATAAAERPWTADGLVAMSLPAVFLPAPLPRDGRLAFYDPEGAEIPVEGDGDDARRTDLTVVRPHGAGVRRRTVPALSLPVDEALPLLVRARREPSAHPATACWGAAALH
ncbi:ATP-dependent helicase, partial [Streptomyces pseudogriseolus]